MLDRLVRRVDIVTDGGANALHLVGSNHRTNPRSADHDRPHGAPGGDFSGNLAGNIGKINGLVIKGADIRNVVSKLFHTIDNAAFQSPAGMIRPNCKTHDILSTKKIKTVQFA